jgi:hypothetical protein
MRVCLVVRVVNSNNETIGGYAREVDLPFVPTVGMKFKQGISTRLWETENGELSPSVNEVVYNFDEETIYCLFEVNEFLKSAFWTEIKSENLHRSFELSQFETRQ